MQSRDADQTNSEHEPRNGGDAFARKVAGFVILPIILIATYFISQIPYTVSSFRQFDDYANGKRVRFTGTYRELVGDFSHVDFDGETILVVVQPGENQLSPDAGAKYCVTGELQRSWQSSSVTITNAEFLPSN
ncbi:hypothetical protein CA13_09390 [Planctomycetes bacterium CA13]|uniref:Bacterial OB-fold domain-containing protein n=1 Tax=Novipirellula herctigrandis TaxID=2527986 RepID=A0A5C5YYG9_9BACT|nr:hypothetical protein CA13_09370 [Planctomycetes bacterium CA13]TWT79535.1 hypothetical protein CA13_09390 [Planctomycetes bacterium CA13]